SRNVGNNHGFITWQRYENPKLFHVRGDPLSYPAYSCLVRHRDRRIAVRALCFDKDRVLEGDTDVTEEVSWCAYANWVLRDGTIVSVEDIIDQIYDNPPCLGF
ncbi:MAG TPA: hypothetical protein VHH94_01085, partial [Gammaproteobacteria bacterium]|nr:hypothetical protein [Gammaproteobacteria bacterium]